jgi:glycosyltransferase involved in cell wall biosynthesis
VHRPWDNTTRTLPELVRAVQKLRLSHLIVQYHHAFYPPEVLAALVAALSACGVRVYVIYHATHHEDLPKAAVSLRQATENLVHSLDDIKRLKAYGIGNVTLFPHGIYVPADDSLNGASRETREDFCIGGFGFLMPHKGFLELICAGYLLRRHIPHLRVRLLAPLYPSAASEKLFTRCYQYIRYLNCSEYVTLDTRYREVNELIAELRLCDLLVFPYQRTQESSSAAVRMGLAARRPVLCTPLPIFDDVKEIVHFTAGFDAIAISDSILELYQNPKLLHGLDNARNHYLDSHSWAAVARILIGKMVAPSYSHQPPAVAAGSF